MSEIKNGSRLNHYVVCYSNFYSVGGRPTRHQALQLGTVSAHRYLSRNKKFLLLQGVFQILFIHGQPMIGVLPPVLWRNAVM